MFPDESTIELVSFSLENLILRVDRKYLLLKNT